jgi:hypothetical protein
MESRQTLIACEIFKYELEQVLSPKKEITIHWLDAALHANSERLKTELEGAVAAIKSTHPGGIYFLFGNGCHPDICKIAEDCGAQIPGVSNCIQAIIGPAETKKLEADRTMVVTPAWISAWPSIMDGLGWDEVDVRINMGRYDRILLLDSGVVSIADEEILALYDLVQVPIEIEQVNLAYFRNLMNQILDDR